MKKAVFGLFAVVVILGCCTAVPFYDNLRNDYIPPSLYRTQLIPLALSDTVPQPSSTFPQIWRRKSDNPSILPLYSNFGTHKSFFVPLEQREHSEIQQPRTESPFDVSFIETDVGGTDPANAFAQTFPIFGPNLFNTFGSFGFGFETSYGPWWKGPNVCKKQIKDEDDMKGEKNSNNTKDNADDIESELQLTVNSCIEKTHKYECTKSVTKNGKKQSERTTFECCRGFGRAHATDSTTPCEKLEVKSLEVAADEFGCKYFIASMKASSSINELLANQKKLTIFMPLDQSFENYKDQLERDTNSVDANIGEDMKSLIQRHILEEETSLYDLKNDQMLKTLDGNQEIRFNSYVLASGSTRRQDTHYAANCIPIRQHDILTEQGLVNTLGGVLKPVTKSIMDIIRERSDLSIMRKVLKNTKLDKLLEGKDPKTVFVPTDAAFEKLDPTFRKAIEEGKSCASNAIKNHILDFTFCSLVATPGLNVSIDNILGDVMKLSRSSGNTNSEVRDLVGDRNTNNDDETANSIVINSISKIIEADIMGTNGVIHIIDTILPTNSALPLTSLMEQKGASLFRKLIEASGFNEKLNEMTNITLLAPTDKAINQSKWADYLKKSSEELRGSSELSDFIKYHIYSPKVKTCELSEEMVPSVAGPKLRVNLYSTHPFFTELMNRATVNCARLVHFDDESCNSILHQVDKVLEPPTMNLLQMLEANPNYSKFLELVRQSNLSKILEKSDDDFTLLVPKNDVFDYITDWEEFKNKDTEVQDLVKEHIVNHVVCCTAIVSTNWPFTRTVENLKGSRLRLSRDRRPTVQNAGITKCDTVATNGIIHEINDVIVAPLRWRWDPED